MKIYALTLQHASGEGAIHYFIGQPSTGRLTTFYNRRIEELTVKGMEDSWIGQCYKEGLRKVDYAAQGRGYVGMDYTILCKEIKPEPE